MGNHGYLKSLNRTYKMFIVRKRNIDLIGYTLAMISVILMTVCCCFQKNSWFPWISCGKNSDCQAWKAFLCLSIIFMFLGFLFDRARKFGDLFNDDNRVHLITGIIWFLGGVFEVIALSIYTAWYTAKSPKWPASYALGWVAAILGLFAGIMF